MQKFSTSILICLLSLLAYSPLFAQFTSIPDTLFEAALVNQGIDSDGTINGQILNSDAAAVNGLYISGQGIHDLTGIEAFVNLDSLVCRNNNLTNLDISAQTSLTYLRVTNNQITALDLSNNPDLILVYCDTNNLTSLDVSTNTALKYVDCKQNNLTVLTFQNHPNLTGFNCNKNNLTSLTNLGGCSILSSILADDNDIDTIDVSTTSALRTLSVYRNDLDYLNLSNNNNLYLLKCGYNALTNLLLAGKPILKTVYAQGNKLTNIDVTGCVDLELLSVINNDLATLDVSTNTMLNNLGCYNNQLTQLDVSTLSNLAILNCNHNELTALDLRNNPNLTRLHCNDNQLANLECSAKYFLNDLKCHNNQIRYLNIKNTAISVLRAENNWHNLEICVDDVVLANNQIAWVKDATAVYKDDCFNTTILGHIRHDVDTNCIASHTEQGLPNHILRFSTATDTFFTSSNMNGFYTGELDTGNYTVDVIPKIHYWSACALTQNAVVDSLTDRDTIDWAMRVDKRCPYLRVVISTPFLSKAAASTYLVQYCNEGTGLATDVYVEVDIDTFLNVLSTSLPIASQTGTVYRFDLDSLEIGECGLFSIDVQVDNSAMTGQTHCTEAHIYPDSLCDNSWNGAVINASSNCLGDTVEFRLRNTGPATAVTTNYSIFEDYVLLHVDPFDLGAGADTIIKVPTDTGKTYRIEAEQQPGFPRLLGASIAHATVVGCNPYSNGTFNFASVPQYYHGNPAPWAHNHCEANVSTPPTNTKSAQQTGFGTDHLITNNVPIDYSVDFQNTGSGAVTNVVIIDTISPHLDPSTLNMQGGSHPYTWSLGQNNVLTVEFKGINLPSSSGNFVASNANDSRGYFFYEIQQKKNLAPGTVINSKSMIYFDNDPPIITSTIFHTVDTNFVPLDTTSAIMLTIDYQPTEQVNFRVFPNPFDYETTLEISGAIYESLEVEIVDVAGRVLRTEQVSNSNQITIVRGNLIAGIYFYRIKGNSSLIGVGKLMIRS